MKFKQLKRKLIADKELDADMQRIVYTAKKNQVIIADGCVVECIMEFPAQEATNNGWLSRNHYSNEAGFQVVYASTMLGDPYFNEYDSERAIQEDFQLYKKV